MKKLFIVFFLFSVASLINAQWVVNGFESAAADSMFFYSPKTSGLASGSGSLVLTDVTDPVHAGTGAMKVDYVVHSSESYGGYTEFQYLRPQDNTFFDWSGAEKLRLWYYVITPYTTGEIYFRFKILESGGSANYQASKADHEDWYFQGSDIYGAAPGWNYIDMPLIDRGGGSPNAEGFSLTGWSGTNNNTTLDFDKITGYMVDFITNGISDNGTASGTVVFDNLEFVGTKYPAITNFDSLATNNYFVIDQMEWTGVADQMGKVTLTDVTDQPFEGYSSMKFDFTVNNSQSWGGYVNIQHNLPDGTFLQDMTANQNLLLYYKIDSATTGAAGRVTMRMFLYDESSGVSEPWQITVPIDLYTATSGWQMVKIPLDDKGIGASALRSDGFVIPSWASPTGDGVLNLDKIAAWKFEFSGSADAPFVQGEICKGSIMLDLMSPTGYRETDATPPEPPTGLLGVAGTYSNLVTWNDVPGEAEETYDVYYSSNPITDITAPGVEVAKLNVPENTQLAEHVLRAPLTDQQVSYYYAVNATDKVGNVGLATSLASPITNTAKGVNIISYDVVPTNFVADGAITEWGGITPLHLSVDPAHQTAYTVTNSTIDGDADLMCDVYLAMDASYLYIAFDIEDDVLVPNASTSSWLNDCPDLFIGLYDWHGAPHGAYHRGAQPDYHVRFAYNRILFDGISGADPVLELGENYFFGEKFPTGYTVEARIPWTTFTPFGGDSLFVPQRGMRIPIDYEINDNDDPAGTRSGQMDYSQFAEGTSYASTSVWTYTWIGNQWTVGVNDNDVKKLSYELSQNYPNPFNPTTQIRYTLEKPGFVTLKIYDVLGRQVKELVNGNQNSGVYNVNFDASGLSSGIYMYQINTEGFQSSKKMMLIK